MKKIWGNMIVKNEDRYIWFSIMSVIKHLDRLLIYDTGSLDNTVKIIESLKSNFQNKITFKEVGEVDSIGMTKLRQRMLEETKSDWFILVDGDEVWWEQSILEILNIIQTKGDSIYCIVNPVINLIGDIYHFQDDSLGKYKILNKTGHFNIRAINKKIKGLNVKNEYPLEGFFDENEVLLQNQPESKIYFSNTSILHFTNLHRSSVEGGDYSAVKRKSKMKFDLGKKFPKDFKYPEVFYKNFPNFVPNPWEKRSSYFFARAGVEYPLKILKRRFFDAK